MATKPLSTAPAAHSTDTAPADLSTLKTIGILLTPAWIILAVVLEALVTGEIAL